MYLNYGHELDEEDIFESDFESTDEEGEQEDVDAAAEKLIRQEESRIRKVSYHIPLIYSVDFTINQALLVDG